MSLQNWFINQKLKGAYSKMSNDKKATFLGVILAGLQAGAIDYGKLVELNPAEAGKLAGVIVTAVLAWYINRPDKEKAAEPKG